jgi:hypothetical protein
MGQDESVFNHVKSLLKGLTLEACGCYPRVLPGSGSVNVLHFRAFTRGEEAVTGFRKLVHPVSIPATLAASLAVLAVSRNLCCHNCFE